jgi:hypothetical protein
MGIRKKKPLKRKEPTAQPADLEVAKKMLKIYQSAIDRKLDFNLSFDTVKKLMAYKTCFYTGREFESDGPYAMSFDRVDSSKGYIEGNLVSCTIDINSKKSNLTYEEIEMLYQKLSHALTHKPEVPPEEEKEE